MHRIVDLSSAVHVRVLSKSVQLTMNENFFGSGLSHAFLKIHARLHGDRASLLKNSVGIFSIEIRLERLNAKNER